MSTKFHQTGFLLNTQNIPQFDLLSLSAQMFGLLASFAIFYNYNLKNTLSNCVEINKINTKKIMINSNVSTLLLSETKNIFSKDLLVYSKFL